MTHTNTIDMKKFKEGLDKTSEMMARLMEESHARQERFFGILIPLLKPKAI